MSDDTALIASLKQDIEDLQTQLQFQEDTLQQLDGVVVDQGELIDKLTRRLILLEDKITDLAEKGDTEKTYDQEKPPHY